MGEYYSFRNISKLKNGKVKVIPVCSLIMERINCNEGNFFNKENITIHEMLLKKRILNNVIERTVK